MEHHYSAGVKKYIHEAEKYLAKRKQFREEIRRLKFDTIAVHGMYSMEEAFQGGQGGIIEPLFPSTSQGYRDSDELEAGLAYLIPTWCYSRIHNPTVFYLEETLSLLESYGCETDASALCTASGMSAIKQAIEPLLDIRNSVNRDINFISSPQIYGGAFQLFNLRMKERGAQVRWVTDPLNIKEWEEQVDEQTRFLYVEMPSNPKQACCDIKAVAELAHHHEIPLIVDATIATPALMRPIQHDADIVVHSLTKSIGSGGFTIGGAVVARHNLTSRHLPDEVKTDYALWLKLWPFRDSGHCMSPYSAFFLLNDLRTIRIKMQFYSQNTLKVAQFLARHKKVEHVDYLGLKDHPLHSLASRYMEVVDSGEKAFGHLMSFNVRSTAEHTRTFFDNLKRVWRATDLGRVKSVATIPAISTHMQQGEEGRQLAHIPHNLVRLCVGGEHPEDIIADLDQALNSI
ncbi:MAG: aminotransferase class I/II-fold pyridoxal phosphate-dependent enzyme [Candidatus Aminicenantales bacterium]